MYRPARVAGYVGAVLVAVSGLLPWQELVGSHITVLRFGPEPKTVLPLLFALIVGNFHHDFGRTPRFRSAGIVLTTGVMGALATGGFLGMVTLSPRVTPRLGPVVALLGEVLVVGSALVALYQVRSHPDGSILVT